MSVDFFVICRGPAPPDLERFVGSQALPFHFGLESIESWRSDTLGWIADLDERSEFDHELERRLTQPWGFVACLNCRAAAAEFTDLCARELLARAGGFYYDDHSAELSAVVQATGTWTGESLVDAWVKLLHDHEGAQQRLDMVATAEHDAARAADPEAFAEADAWSDV